jgi:glycosyltransferase involved in cell wall biosynthesis
MFAAELAGIPYSFTVHGPDEYERASVLSLDEKLRRAAFAVCVSAYGRCQLMLSSPIDLWPKIAVIHCGVDSAAIDVPSIPANPRLVCVGRLDERKAQLVLVEAVRRLRDEGVECQVVLVGDGPMRPNIEAAIRNANLQDLITITGWVPGDTVKAEMEAARGLVLSSFFDDIPIAIIEAMAMGRPVISTYVGGIPELVTPEKTGWLVPPGDYDALAGAIQNLIEASGETLSVFGAAARARVLERHDALKEATKLNQLFEAARPDIASDQGALVTQAVKLSSW